MVQFVDERLDENVEQGATGGPTFFTSVIDLANASEQRNENWAYQRLDWDIGYGIQSQFDFDTVLNLFYVTAGRTYGFRFQDWSDYFIGMSVEFDSDNQIVLTSTASSAQILGFSDGVTTAYQMFKLYATQTSLYLRPITRPVQDTLTVYVNGAEKALGSDYTCDFDTGIITFADAPEIGALIAYSVQFDVPVRFDTDMLKQKVTYSNALQIAGIKIVELKEYTGAFNIPTLQLDQPAYPIQWNALDTTVGAVSTDAVALSADGTTAYFFATGSSDTAGVKVVDLTVASETAWSAYANLFTTSGRTVSPVNAVGTDGYLYMIDGYPSSWTPLVKISSFSLQEVESYGTDSAGLPDIYQILPMQVSGSNMMICVSSLGINATLLNVDTMTMVGTAYTAPGSDFGSGLSVSPGSQTSGSVYTAYGLQWGDTDEATYQLDVLSLVVEDTSLTVSNIVSFLPADIDATWTEFTSWSGPIYDATDGNLILQFQDGFAATPSYIVKVNASTGDIMWQTAAATNFPSGWQSTVRNGKLYTFAFPSGGQQALQTIDTSTGALVSTDINMTSIGDYVELAGYGDLLFYGALTGYVSDQWALFSPYGSIILRQTPYQGFIDERLDENIETGANGGPSFLTTVIMLANAFEGRNQEWQYPLQEWNIGYGVQSLQELQGVLDFFYVCRGRAAGFRFRDWTDYTIGDPVYYVVSNAQAIGTGDGSNALYQIYKQYNSKTGEFLRPVTRPVQGTLEVYLNQVLQVENTAFTCNYGTGLITFLSGHIPGLGVAVSASLQFDIPVRFDDDAYRQKVTWVGATELAVMKIKEIKEYGGNV